MLIVNAILRYKHLKRQNCYEVVFSLQLYYNTAFHHSFTWSVNSVITNTHILVIHTAFKYLPQVHVWWTANAKTPKVIGFSHYNNSLMHHFFFVSLHPLLPLEREKKKKKLGVLPTYTSTMTHTHTRVLQNSSTAFKIRSTLSNREKTKKEEGEALGGRQRKLCSLYASEHFPSSY